MHLTTMRIFTQNSIYLCFLLPGVAWAQLSVLPQALLANVSASLNSTWDTNVQQVCAQAVTAAAGRVDNPSGLLACYNVATLESITGLFSGDVRLYSVAKSSLPSNSSVQLSIDFGQAGVVQSATQAQPVGSSHVSIMRRSPIETSAPQPQSQNSLANASKGKSPAQIASSNPRTPLSVSPNTSNSTATNKKVLPLAGASQTQATMRPGSVTNPPSSVRPGSQAGIAKPHPDLKPIVASPLNPPTVQNTVPAAILPGEKLQNRQEPQANADRVESVKQIDVVTSNTEAPGLVSLSTSILSTTTSQSGSNQELEKLQFIGRLNVDLANSNPNGLGPAGSLLPKIYLLVTMQNQPQTSIDMSKSTSAYLQGIRGSLVPVGTFILPGRILLGEDGSTDRAGLFVYGIYFLLFSVMMFGGVFTRLRIRNEYHTQTN